MAHRSRIQRHMMASGGLIAAGMLLGACVAVTPSPAYTTTSTPRPTATASATLTPTPTATSMPTPVPTEALALTPTAVPPLRGSFDVYLSAPDEDGQQTLVWIDILTGAVAARTTIRTDDGYAIRAGQYVYFHAYGTRYPQRANTAGAVEPVRFAYPPAGSEHYQLLPSANGQWLAWASTGRGGTYYEISLAAQDGSGARVVLRGESAPGTALTLIRVTNDGRQVFLSMQPADVADTTLFNARYDLHVVDTLTGTDTRLPGEPACGVTLVCDGHISPDGAYLARTLPPTDTAEPAIVTNLVSGQVIGRFAPLQVPPGSAYEVGYPYFTPSGDLIYTEAIGTPGLENYLLVHANLVTGEQRVIADLGQRRHRPLGWTGEGFVLLTTREPGAYDTWQIDIRSGMVRQIASLLYLGHIEVLP